MAEQIEFPWAGQDLLTVSDAARELGLSAQMVRVLCDTGRLKHVLVSKRKHRMFKPEWVKDCKEDRAVSALFAEFSRPQTFAVRYASAARRSG